MNDDVDDDDEVVNSNDNTVHPVRRRNPRMNGMSMYNQRQLRVTAAAAGGGGGTRRFRAPEFPHRGGGGGGGRIRVDPEDTQHEDINEEVVGGLDSRHIQIFHGEDNDYHHHADYDTDDSSDMERTARPVSGWSIITTANPPSPRSLHAATLLVRIPYM
jgi:hypothetical protein